MSAPIVNEQRVSRLGGRLCRTAGSLNNSCEQKEESK